MSNITETSVDIGSLLLETGEQEDGLLTFAGADTYVKGTILARDSSTGKFVLFVKGGVTNGNGVPKAVLLHDTTATGATDESVRVLVEGRVNVNRLVIDADGDASNIDGAVRDQLRDYKITPVDVKQIGGALYTDEDS
jgi:hypothetical protein